MSSSYPKKRSKIWVAVCRGNFGNSGGLYSASVYYCYCGTFGSSVGSGIALDIVWRLTS